jgi:phosphohistidine phosphatase
MKVVYLVRHAKSSWEEADLDDINRPLNGRGKKDAPEMGQRLRKQGIKPDLMISSPAKRAFTTARKIAEEIQYSEESIMTEDGFYHGDSNSMLSRIKIIPDEVNRVMLFGHNPTLTEFANALCGISIYNIPTCGIVAIELEINSWKMADNRKGKLVFFDYPKKNIQQ